MTSRTLADRLIERAFRSRRNSSTGTGVSRRGFLVGLGSLGGTAALPSLAQATPVLTRTGSAVSLHQGDAVWRIDPARFGARAAVTGTEQGDELRLRLRRATLPGTTLRVDVSARVFLEGQQWRVSVTVPQLRLRGTLPLADWLSRSASITAPARLPSFRLGDHRVSGPPSVLASFNADFATGLDAGRDRLTLSGREGLTGRRLQLAPHDSAGELTPEHLPNDTPSGVTRFALEEPAATPNIALGAPTSGAPAFCPAGVDTCSGEVAGADATITGVTLIDGHGWVELPDGDMGTRLRLERASVSRSSDGVVALAGRIARAPQMLEAGACAVQVAGDDEAPFYCEVRDGRPVSLDAKVKLYEVWLPIPDADQGRLVAREVVALPLRWGENGADIGEASIALGSSGGVRVPGEAVRLNIRRGVDLFNLDFEFAGFDLDLRRRSARLVRRASSKGGWSPAALAVLFPPQHVSETIGKAQDPRFCKTPDDMPDVSRAKLSGPSRVAFKIDRPGEPPRWTERRLSIAALTEWKDLALEVCARALPTDAPLETQLEIEGIGTAPSMAEASNRIAAQLRPPEAHQTALELSTRLILSPPEAARFITASPLADPNLAPLWTTRLDERGRASLRVIWSRFLKDGGDLCLTGLPAAFAATPPIAPSDQRELVLLMSIYGMPALRAIREDNGSGTDPLAKIARSTVVRPVNLPPYLQGADKEDFGLFMPVPFRAADVILSSIGATVRAEWIGEPPDLKGPKPWSGGLTVERLAIDTFLGRDIVVEVLHKGYLLPLGVRASYVELVERRLFRNPNLGNKPVAFPVRRRFITIQRPERAYPGVNQPYEGRECPMRSLTMITRRTPDLVEPAARGGAIAIGASKPEHAFWPRTAPGVDDEAGVFAFKWAVDGDPAPVTSPLFFVSNAVTTNPDLTHAAVKHYRELGASNRRVARHAGARRRYADPITEGDTAFGTDHWVLSARGRLLPSETGATESFLMDGRMEGADQPPFYPVLERAEISIQSLDRLLGAPQGLISVCYNSEYVAYGFAPSKNAAQIFLNVLGPDIALNLNGGGQAAGGLAKPNTLVAALSRSNGIIGGQRATLGSVRAATAATARVRAAAALALPARLVAALTPAARRDFTDLTSEPDFPSDRRGLALTVEAPPRYDFSDSLRGIFNGKQFFEDDASLLGLVKFSDVVPTTGFGEDVGPRLLEKIGYGAVGKDVLDSIKTVVINAEDVPQALRTLVKQSIDENNTLFFQDIYPRFYAVAIETAAQLERSIAVIQKAKTLADIVEPAAKIVASGKALVAAIEDLIRDPVPDVIEGNINQILALWTQFKSGVGDTSFLRERFYALVLAPQIESFCRALDRTRLSSVIWGQAGGSCATIVQDPSSALDALGDSLFRDAFAQPLLEMLRDIREFATALTADLRIAGGRVEREVMRICAELIAAWPDIAGDAPIRQHARQAELAAAMVERLQARLSALTGGSSAPKSNDELLATLNKVLSNEQLGGGFADDIAATIDAYAALITTTGTSAAVVIADMKRRAGLLHARFVEAVRADAQRIRALVEAAAQGGEQRALARIFALIDKVVHAIERSATFAQVSEAGRAVNNWCGRIASTASAKVVLLADDLASRVLGDPSAIATSLTTMRDAVARLAIPGRPDAERRRLETLQRTLLAEIDQLVALCSQIVHYRSELRSIRNDLAAGGAAGICADVGRFLDPANALMNLRREAVERLTIILREADALTRSQPAAFVATAAKPPAEVLKIIVTEGKALLRDLTGLASAGTQRWRQIDAAVTTFANAISARTPDYAAQLLALLDRVGEELLALDADLQDAKNLAAVRRVARDLATFVETGERRLTALALQSSALTDVLADQLGALCALVLRELATWLLPLHQTVAGTVQGIHDALSQDPVLRLLINPELMDTLRRVGDLLATDVADLGVIAVPNSPIEKILPRARRLADRWQQPDRSGLIATVTLVSALVSNIARGKFDQLISTGPLLQRIRDEINTELRDLLSKLVPTRVDLTYDLETQLKPVLLAGEPFFKMTASTKKDLVLKTHVTIDLATQRRSARFTGTLNPFEIRLLGDLDIATLRFKSARFEAIDGGAPTFDIDLEGVDLGSTLRMLDALQAWFSPNDTGFYIKPISVPGPGVEAGYVYGADLIQVGTLQFINVSLGAAVRLPFGSHSAELLFWCSSAENMFLIASPPYGGAGYFNVRSRRGGATDVSLALACGAVAAIKFGPLQGHGHILAGIGYESARGTITGFVEAVGEGNIGCFGMCICIRVTLEHQTKSGRVDGESVYHVEFRLGFAKFKYGFTANYTIAEGNGDGAQGLLDAQGARGAAAATTRVSRFAVTTPRKADEWVEYKRGVALELLGDEG